MKGILFKPDMLQAIAEGRKTVTRRMESSLKEINKAPEAWFLSLVSSNDVGRGWYARNKYTGYEVKVKPRYSPGEVVYCKEAWCEDSTGAVVHYKADGGESPGPTVYFGKDRQWHEYNHPFWRSPRVMPEWAARHFIRIVSVRPERLQEITDEDAIKEGVSVRKSTIEFEPIVADYAALWDTINGAGSWDRNGWVFRYQFEKVDR